MDNSEMMEVDQVEKTVEHFERNDAENTDPDSHGPMDGQHKLYTDQALVPDDCTDRSAYNGNYSNAVDEYGLSNDRNRDSSIERRSNRESGKVKEYDEAEDDGSGKRRDSKERIRGKEQDHAKQKDRYDKPSSKEKHRDRVTVEDSALIKKDDHGTKRQRDRLKDKYKDDDSERDFDHVRGRKEKESEWREEDREKQRNRDSDRDKEREREKGSEREKDRDRVRDKVRDRDQLREERDRNHDKEKEKGREREWTKERERDRERGRERNKEEREKMRETERDKGERDKGRTDLKEKERGRDRERDAIRGKYRDRDHDRSDRDRERIRDKDKRRNNEHDLAYDREMEHQGRGREKEADSKSRSRNDSIDDDLKDSDRTHLSTAELEGNLLRVKEEKLKSKSTGGSDILSWVSKSRKLEEKKTVEKEKAARLAKILEEQDNINESESDNEEKTGHTGEDLAGLKILHGLDKVVEGGAVVLTLKDQNILAGGDINEEVDMFENIEIGEQKARNEAYKAAKKKPGVYEDKFQNDIYSLENTLPQYDDPSKEEGIMLNEKGQVDEESQKRLEEIRRRLQGSSMRKLAEDSLAGPTTSTSDYYTHDEMLKFKKPKKVKRLRKRDKLDINALEAEAIAEGIGANDRGSRNNERQSLKEIAKKEEAEQRKKAYEAAYNKASEASKVLREGRSEYVQQVEEEENTVFGAEEENLYKSLEKARKEALKKQSETMGSGPQAVARLAANQSAEENKKQLTSDGGENKVVITEMEEFVWSLQLHDDSRKAVVEDVFKEDDDGPEPMNEDIPLETPDGSKEIEMDTDIPKEEEEDVKADDIIQEVPVGKGLAGALQLLKERGTLKDTVEWGGRNMDKKKSKLVGIRDNEGPKEIQLDRLDEFGRIMTPKEAFRKLSHKFHGKGPGKMKQEKRMKQFQEDMKLKQMTTGDTPMMAMEKMRDIQAKLHAPYIVLSGHIKPGQTSDPRSGFATVEKEFPGSLTPMLGDKKVEHFLGIKRKPEDKPIELQKKPKS